MSPVTSNVIVCLNLAHQQFPFLFLAWHLPRGLLVDSFLCRHDSRSCQDWRLVWAIHLSTMSFGSWESSLLSLCIFVPWANLQLISLAHDIAVSAQLHSGSFTTYVNCDVSVNFLVSFPKASFFFVSLCCFSVLGG